MWDDVVNTVTSFGGLAVVVGTAAVVGGATYYFAHTSEDEQKQHDAEVAKAAYAQGKADQKKADDAELKDRVDAMVAEALARAQQSK